MLADAVEQKNDGSILPPSRGGACSLLLNLGGLANDAMIPRLNHTRQYGFLLVFFGILILGSQPSSCEED